MTKVELMDKMAALLGGAAEMIVFQELSTRLPRSSNDIANYWTIRHRSYWQRKR